MTKQVSRPRAGLSREKVLDAAAAFVDEHGLPALSMRKLGTALGVEAMTLYYYVPSKAALFDGLVERTVEAALDGLVDRPSADWRETAISFAHGYRARLLRHPGVLPLIATRPVNSPRGFDTAERALAAFEAAGLPAGRAMDLFNALGTFAIGHTLAEIGRPTGHEETAEPPAEIDAGTHPRLAALVASGEGLDFDARFTAVVGFIVEGFAPEV
ncbi:TetR/AcrR family transcriptional regulator C-terminal domain-containing protein [Phytomonospora endophytica]|uniref:AcrR family transcriptional regulator n=1 Tax=Phytomonospora endophytica TaxID=714109 RepID=A0A841FKB5_9ACTN|nr:TetR/AcrR family transcriptional regulator C-terminal domain-containing protein [Phytomonospora endophytica]MBB6036314.1 AcrR family transcriptional regulator [Phytomonospora endophytica]GIG67221.1 hypothetical protein Pen01_35160 [Phytomonospora endophytica]